MNKLLFTLEQHWGENIVLVANNEKDLGDYLRQELGYNHVSFCIDEASVDIKKEDWSEWESGKIKWIKHV